MKLHISKTDPVIEDDEFEKVHPEEIAKIEDGSCEFVRLGSSLDEYHNRVELFSAILKKVRYGGRICMSGLDIGVTVRNILNGRFDNARVNEVLYDGKHSISDMTEMKKILTTEGFNVMISRYEKNSYFIEAERPKPNG